MELHDLLEDREFLSRHHPRNVERNIQALGRLAHVFATTPEIVLQELVDVAVGWCGADSAGISLEEPTATGEQVFRWVAISGRFSQYLNATAPRFFSPCGTCLDTGRAQHYRVTKPYYDHIGIAAEEITDGMLIPWEADGLRGTIWAVAHCTREAFDHADYQLLSTLADFASIAVRHQHQQRLLRQKEREAASAAKANELAHRINNPLQSLTNTLYLAREGGGDVARVLDLALAELSALSMLVKDLLGNIAR